MKIARQHIVGWAPVVISTAAWIVHLVGISGLVRYTCNRPARLWVLQAVTAVCLSAAVGATVVAARGARGEGSEDQATSRSWDVFSARLALLACAANVLLISLEEVYVLALGSHRCV